MTNADETPRTPRRPERLNGLRAGIVVGATFVLGILLLAALPSPTPSTPTTTTTALPTTTTTLAPEKVTVQAYNATGGGNVATSVSQDLARHGWNTLSGLDALERSPTSTVRYAPGFDAQARTIASQLGLSPSAAIPYVADLALTGQVPAGTDIVVICGPELATLS